MTNVRTFASAAEAAAYYVGQGILPVPVAYRGKNPKGNDWEKLRIDAASVPDHFNGTPQNIGALLGISGTGTAGLIDVDLDAPEALSVASAFLPATGFIFGRESKPASHRFYFSDPPVRLQQSAIRSTRNPCWWNCVASRKLMARSACKLCCQAPCMSAGSRFYSRPVTIPHRQP